MISKTFGSVALGTLQEERLGRHQSGRSARSCDPIRWPEHCPSSFSNAALRREINCEATEPVASLVMLAGHRCEASAAMRFCCAR
jgi:hypothetical protein